VRPPAAGAEAAGRKLFQSDMSLMTGMAPPRAVMAMGLPRWSTMVMGVVAGGWNHQGGASGDDAVEAVDWNMVMARGGRIPGHDPLADARL